MNPLEIIKDRLQGRNLSEVARRASMARDNVGRLASGKQDDLYVKTYVHLSKVLDDMDKEVK